MASRTKHQQRNKFQRSQCATGRIGMGKGRPSISARRDRYIWKYGLGTYRRAIDI